MVVGPHREWAARRSQGAAHHPRMYGVENFMYSSVQAAGCTTFCRYIANYSVAGGGAYDAYVLVWNSYYAWDMVDGRGDGSDGKYNNLADLGASVPPGAVDLSRAVSVTGQLVRDWNAATAVKNPPVGQRARFGPPNPGAGHRSGASHTWASALFHKPTRGNGPS